VSRHFLDVAPQGAGRPTPHLPHGWDAGVLFDETDSVLLCSDLLHQIGDVEPVTSVDITDRYRHTLASYQQSPVLMDYVPYNANTRPQLTKLADLTPPDGRTGPHAPNTCWIILGAEPASRRSQAPRSP